MSRSRKRVPIFGITTACSDKPYKVDEHRRERRNVRQAVTKHADGDHPALSSDYGNPWGSPKDGRQYWHKARARDMIK